MSCENKRACLGCSDCKPVSREEFDELRKEVAELRDYVKNHTHSTGVGPTTIPIQ